MVKDIRSLSYKEKKEYYKKLDRMDEVDVEKAEEGLVVKGEDVEILTDVDSIGRFFREKRRLENSVAI